MIDRDLFHDALRSFVSSMARSYDMTEMSHELCDRTAAVVSAAGAGVGVSDADGAFRFVTGTTDRIVALERIQEETQEGPCVLAFRTMETVVIPDLGRMDAWPAYLEVAESSGLQSVVGSPLTVRGEALGALNVYHDEPREWTEEEISGIGVFADMATAYLVRVSELQEAHRLAEQLQGALDSRVLIEQAKGMVASQLGIGVDAAFAVLRRHARANQLKLADLANGVVNMGLRIPTE